MQNDLNYEKVTTSNPINENQRQHMLDKLRDKINFIKKELEAFEINRALRVKEIEEIDSAVAKRKLNLENYLAKREEVLAINFEEEEAEVEQPPADSPKEDPKVEELKEALKKKGFSLEDLLQKLGD